VNVSKQQIDGVDSMFDYKIRSHVGDFSLFLNGTYLELRQTLTPTSLEEYLSGTTFYPPRFRARGGTTWTAGPWSATGTVNYIGGSTNTFQPTRDEVSSWTTMDAQASYESSEAGLAHGLRVSVSVLNLRDRAPPYVLFDSNAAGFHYDSTNVTPLGRYITLQIAKQW
jgi:hypothetical protein